MPTGARNGTNGGSRDGLPHLSRHFETLLFIRCYRRIRGKVPFDLNRDARLLRAAEAILIGALDLDERVREKFLEHDAYATM